MSPRTQSYELDTRSVFSRPRPRSNHRRLVASDLDVVFQPVVDLAGNAGIIGYEALARSRLRALPDAESLFAMAEAEGKVLPLAAALRRMVFARAPAGALFVNLHPAELNDPSLLAQTRPSLWFEVSARHLTTGGVSFARRLAELCARTSARLVIDQVGAGPVDLLEVASLQPDAIKIDRRLVAELGQRGTGDLLVRQLVELGQEIDARTIAVGVETDAQHVRARSIGVELAQGHYYAKPAFPAPTLGRWAWRGQGRGRSD